VASAQLSPNEKEIGRIVDRQTKFGLTGDFSYRRPRDREYEKFILDKCRHFDLSKKRKLSMTATSQRAASPPNGE
jgi:hypothetical protein